MFGSTFKTSRKYLKIVTVFLKQLTSSSLFPNAACISKELTVLSVLNKTETNEKYLSFFRRRNSKISSVTVDCTIWLDVTCMISAGSATMSVNAPSVALELEAIL